MGYKKGYHLVLENNLQTKKITLKLHTNPRVK
jgi:hypothetical protein